MHAHRPKCDVHTRGGCGRVKGRRAGLYEIELHHKQRGGVDTRCFLVELRVEMGARRRVELLEVGRQPAAVEEGDETSARAAAGGRWTSSCLPSGAPALGAVSTRRGRGSWRRGRHKSSIPRAEVDRETLETQGQPEVQRPHVNARPKLVKAQAEQRQWHGRPQLRLLSCRGGQEGRRGVHHCHCELAQPERDRHLLTLDRVAHDGPTRLLRRLLEKRSELLLGEQSAALAPRRLLGRAGGGPFVGVRARLDEHLNGARGKMARQAGRVHRKAQAPTVTPHLGIGEVVEAQLVRLTRARGVCEAAIAKHGPRATVLDDHLLAILCAGAGAALVEPRASDYAQYPPGAASALGGRSHERVDREQEHRQVAKQPAQLEDRRVRDAQADRTHQDGDFHTRDLGRHLDERHPNGDLD